ncbi:MAG: recombinase family protein, partial [Desulfobacteraceae bacterium]|nr:recombinase family protein [Desulfobacteraceae bacterium]
QTNKLLGQGTKWKEIEKQIGRSRGFLYKLIKEEEKRLKAEDKSEMAARAGRAGAEARWGKTKRDEDRERRKLERRELRKKKPKEVEAIAIVEEERPMRAVGYARVSTAEQAMGESIDTQEYRIPAYCHAKGWVHVKTFSDPGITGKSQRRPGLQEALRMIKEGNIDVLIVSKVDRIARNARDGLNFIFGPLKENACDFAAILEAFDTTTPPGRAMLGILLVFAELESDTTGVRVSETKKFQKERGEWIGRDTLGFKRIENRLVEVPEEQEKGLEIFRLWKRGEALRAISRITGVARPSIKRIVTEFSSWKEYCEYYSQWAESCKRPITKEQK